MAGAQATYYLLTGAWPLLHMPSFVAVTGPKPAHWLVRTIGLLLTVIGTSLGLAASRRRVALEETVLGAGTALALGAVDVTYAARGRIPRVFLLDAMVEFLFAAAWCGVAMRGSTRDPAAGPLRGAIE